MVATACWSSRRWCRWIGHAPMLWVWEGAGHQAAPVPVTPERLAGWRAEARALGYDPANPATREWVVVRYCRRCRVVLDP